MAFVNVALAASAVATVVSGAMAFHGAQVSADAQEKQAKQARLLAANRAQIQRNNAIAQAQDEQFQAGVSRFNKQEALIQTDEDLSRQQDKTRMALASAEAQGARRGTFDYSFDDVLRSEAMLAEREEADILYSGAVTGFQASRSADLAGMRAGRAIEMGQYDSALSITEGNYKAYALKSEASATRIGGYASLAGGLAQGASTTSEIDFT